MFARLASARSAVRVLAVRVLPRSHPLHLWHAAFVVLGFATGAGFVPAALPYVAIVALLVGVVLFVDLPRLVRRERPHAFGFAKAITVCLIVLMAENIALYMVTAFSDMEHDDVELQDNMATFLEAAFDRLPRLKSAFWRSPAMTTDESFLDMFMLVILALTRDAPQLSVCSAAARVVWTLAWCRGLRTLCFSSTVMPSQLKLCSFKRFDLTYSAGEHVREALLRLRFDGGCNDLIFSGHGVFMALNALVHRSYAQPLGFSRWLPVLLWGRTFVRCCRIIVARNHMSVDLIIALTITCVVWSLVPDAAHKQKETGLAVPSRHSSDRGYRGQASGPSGDAVSTRRWLGTLGFMLAWYIAQPLFHTPATMSMASREVARKIAVDSTLMGPKLLCVTVNWLPPPFHVNGQVWSEVASETFGRHCDGIRAWPLGLPNESEVLEQTESADVMRALWLHVGERWMRDFDWVLVFDTISFVVAENMRLLARTAENSAVAASPLHLWLRYDFRSAAARAHLLNRQGVARLAQALSAGAPSCKAPIIGPVSKTEAGDFTANCTTGVPWDSAATRQALGCASGADAVARLNLPGMPACRHAVLTWFAKRPEWFRVQHREIYGSA